MPRLRNVCSLRHDLVGKGASPRRVPGSSAPLREVILARVLGIPILRSAACNSTRKTSMREDSMIEFRNKPAMPFAYGVAIALAACLAALGAARVYAKGAREFAGFYKILKAVNQGDTVELRISLRVFNYSQADVKDATISLESSLPHPPGAGEAWEKRQPSFRSVILHVNERQVAPPLEATFAVPAREYRLWLKGAQPHFVIDYQDAAGKPQHRAIELMRRP